MKKKKKGFTLIELIAVIAILAILGAILVPKISGYKTKALKSSIQSSAKVVVNAIDTYNADASTEISDSVTLTSLGTSLDTIVDTAKNPVPDCLNSLSITNIRKVAKGDFNVTGGSTSANATITVQ